MFLYLSVCEPALVGFRVRVRAGVRSSATYTHTHSLSLSLSLTRTRFTRDFLMLCRVHAAHVRTCMRTDMCVFVLYTHTHTHTHYTPLDAYVACTVYRKTTGKAAQAFAKILFIFLKKITKVYRKTPAKLHKLLPALATQAAHTSTVDAFNHLKHEVRVVCVCVCVCSCAFALRLCVCASACASAFAFVLRLRCVRVTFVCLCVQVRLRAFLCVCVGEYQRQNY